MIDFAISPAARFAYDPSMAALTKSRMTVDEYLAWAGDQPGRHELVAGAVVAMSPEGAGHAEKKAAVQHDSPD